MYRRYKEIASWFIVLIISIFIISCQQGKSSNDKMDNIERTIDRALSWVYGHPANFANDLAFVEISEEIIAFYILSKYSESASQRINYIRDIQKRFDLIASKKDFRVHSREYTMLLAITFIGEKLGLETLDFKRIIEEQMLSDPLLYPPHITTGIWNTVYLERMGYNPTKSLENLMSFSTLSQEVNQRLLFQHVKSQYDPMYLDPIAITTYDITHEIFALTDFGELPPPLIILENQAFFSELFDDVIKWAITAGHVDVLAEAVMCVKILDLKNVLSLERGIEFIISKQKGDGSFGVTNPGRPNVYRHGILVSIMALSMPY